MVTLTEALRIEAINELKPILSDDTSGNWVTVGELSVLSRKWCERLAGPKQLVFHYITNTVDGVAQFLGASTAGHAIALLDPKLPGEMKNELERCYSPGIILNHNDVQFRHASNKIHPNLAVLLTTSGSTGSPKFVRLSANNLISNALAIAEVLNVRGNDVACGHLPLHYSYGLSVLTSHLIVGAPVHLTSKGFLSPDFWTQMKSWRIAHLPGIPFHYKILSKFQFASMNMPDLRVMTQAGGPLDVGICKMAHDYMDSRGGRFHVMYGQTEASPRITTLSHEDFVANTETVGQALPGGRIEILDANNEPGIDGEVIYYGPNVMMGYAERASDLSLGNVMNGCLATGDIGRLDKEGRLTITGRIKRIAKFAGLRVNLDEVERAVNCLGEEFAVLGGDDGILLCHLAGADTQAVKETALGKLVDLFTLPKTAYRFQLINSFPRTSRNKIDYQALSRELGRK